MIPVNEPQISKNAKKYIIDCLDTGWISSAGKYIAKFEKEFAKYIGTKYAVTTTSGTTALHLALATLRIHRGDEIILPDLTIASCALAVLYMGAIPIPVDVEPKTGNIDPEKIEQKITKKTKAIMIVHLYGHPAKMDSIIKIAKKYRLPLIEDVAEAHGAEVRLKTQNGKYNWVRAGSMGNISCFSFYGNKIVTTGEGGMLLTNNKSIYERAISLKDLAHSPKRRFYHEEIGYNFRMTNLQAALGVAQLEEVDKYLEKKRLMARLYTEGLQNIDFLELPQEEPYAKSVYWMYAPRIKKGSKMERDEFCLKLKEKGIDTRTYFMPLHSQPVLRNFNYKPQDYKVSSDLSKRGFYLPSGLAITEKQIEEVVSSIREIAKK